jgi:hypothetical protein
MPLEFPGTVKAIGKKKTRSGLGLERAVNLDSSWPLTDTAPMASQRY